MEDFFCSICRLNDGSLNVWSSARELQLPVFQFYFCGIVS